MHKIALTSLALFLAVPFIAQSESKEPENWYLLHPKKDKTYGTGIEKAYQLLEDRTPKKVVVAVIDSGVDVEHEDLKNVLWTNKDEIPGNGIDDDKNGYIDDVHGWNFLGGKDGDINECALELVRLYQRLSPKYMGKSAEDFSSEADKKEFEYWLTIESDYNAEYQALESQIQVYNTLAGMLENIKEQHGSLSKENLAKYESEDEQEMMFKERLLANVGSDEDMVELEAGIAGAKEHFEGQTKGYKMNDDSLRIAVVGDDPLNVSEQFYGNNNYEGPDALHGTHVAGIIAADRTNNIGVIGEANNVEIMVLRAVPNGDERDKDIANAIRYAVDNGATVVNMSFGKYYSPNKKVVDEAVKYAESKDVLLIHAAGNDHKNKEVETNYPNRYYLDGGVAQNWIDVGASSYKKGLTLPATFSNYGPTQVDLFAPGVAMYNTVPDDKYRSLQGTSMACPSVAGVAAVIRGYFPDLTAPEIKKVLIETCTPYKKDVMQPGYGYAKNSKGVMIPDGEMVKMTDLCVSGGFINAHCAVKQLLKEEKKK